MSDDPVIAAMVTHAKERAELRVHTRDRVLVDPVASMVAKLLRQLCQLRAEEQPDAVLDATAAIMAAYDERVAAGRAQAAADIRASIPEVADYVWDASAPVQREIAAQIAEGGDPR